MESYTIIPRLSSGYEHTHPGDKHTPAIDDATLRRALADLIDYHLAFTRVMSALVRVFGRSADHSA